MRRQRPCLIWPAVTSLSHQDCYRWRQTGARRQQRVLDRYRHICTVSREKRAYWLIVTQVLCLCLAAANIYFVRSADYFLDWVIHHLVHKMSGTSENLPEPIGMFSYCMFLFDQQSKTQIYFSFLSYNMTKKYIRSSLSSSWNEEESFAESRD